MSISAKMRSSCTKERENQNKPTRQEAEEAVRTLISWIGDDPSRENLLDTPGRVLDAYRETFSGYGQSSCSQLSKSYNIERPYKDIVLLRDIEVSSCCEHHMLPFTGKACIAYYPTNRIVGLSKLARTVEIYARRLQTQENLTSQIAEAIWEGLHPEGVAVMINAFHQCMSLRGIRQENVSTITTRFLGRFEATKEQERFLNLIKS